MSILFLKHSLKVYEENTKKIPNRVMFFISDKNTLTFLLQFSRLREQFSDFP